MEVHEDKKHTLQRSIVSVAKPYVGGEGRGLIELEEYTQVAHAEMCHARGSTFVNKAVVADRKVVRGTIPGPCPA